MPRGEQVGCGLREGLALVAEELQRQTGIELGIVHPAALETSILIVLDEPVVGVAGKHERTEPQRVDSRQPQQPQIGLRRFEMRQVEGDQVVSQNELGAVGEGVQFRQRGGQVAARMRHAAAGIAAHRTESMNAVVLADFKIERNAGWPE